MKGKITSVVASLIFSYSLITALSWCTFFYYEPEIPERITELTKKGTN